MTSLNNYLFVFTSKKIKYFDREKDEKLILFCAAERSLTSANSALSASLRWEKIRQSLICIIGWRRILMMIIMIIVEVWGPLGPEI